MEFSMRVLTVTQPVRAQLLDLGGATPVEVELRYHPADPYAVTAAFRAGDSTVPWTFGRELLVAGRDDPAGDGDVHVWPAQAEDGEPVVVVELCSPAGEALVQLSRGELDAFVHRMEAVVPTGRESAHLDVDGAIAALLREH